MVRREALVLRALLCLFVLELSSSAFAQQVPRVYRVAILFMFSPTGTPRVDDVFREAFRDLGYSEGRNLTIDVRAAEGRVERLPILLAELITLKPDVILTFTTDGALAAKQATTTIPIVIMQVADPVGSGIVASLSHPGGNITGMTDYGVDLTAKYVELIHAVVPKASRIGILMSDSPIHPPQVKGIEEAAKTIGLSVLPTMERSDDELQEAFASLAKQHVTAVIVLGGARQTPQRAKIAELALKSGMSTLFPTRAYVDRGGLMSYGPNLWETYRHGARYVDRILKGANPGELPIEQPQKFELVINLRTAKALGLTIPQPLLLRADEVIQ
jgi:putative ABC transport system substrate-binding protein